MSTISEEWGCLLVYFEANWTRHNLDPGAHESFARVQSVVLPGPQDPTSPAIMADVNREICESARILREEGNRNLLFSYCFDGGISESTFSILRSLGFICVNYCVDSYHQWFRHCRDGRNYDAIGVAQSFHMHDLARYFPRVMSMPMASAGGGQAVDFARQRLTRCAILGSRMPYREWLVRNVAERGVSLAVYGKGWSLNTQETQPPPAAFVKSDWGLYVPVLLRPAKCGETILRLFEHIGVGISQRAMLRKSPVELNDANVCLEGFVAGPLKDVFAANVVNIGTSHLAGGWSKAGKCRHVQGRLRDFEVTAAGGFYLVQRHPDLSDLYVEGVEIEAWDDVNELVEKAIHYLEHPDEALGIARRGHERWKREHSWKKRFSDLLDELGGCR